MARYQSAEEVIAVLRRVRSGHVIVQCPVTATRRLCGEATHFLDTWPRLATSVFMMSVVALLAGAGYIVSTLR